MRNAHTQRPPLVSGKRQAPSETPIAHTPLKPRNSDPSLLPKYTAMYKKAVALSSDLLWEREEMEPKLENEL